MLEKDIETKIIEAVEALELPGLWINGGWQVATAGSLKGSEDPRAKAALVVKVGPRTFETFGICMLALDVTITLAVRADLCPRGEELVTYADAVAGLLQDWNLVESGEELTALQVEGTFDPGGVQITGGSGPDFTEGTWTVQWSLTIRGTIPHEEQNENEGNEGD